MTNAVTVRLSIIINLYSFADNVDMYVTIIR